MLLFRVNRHVVIQSEYTLIFHTEYTCAFHTGARSAPAKREAFREPRIHILEFSSKIEKKLGKLTLQKVKMQCQDFESHQWQ